MSNDKNINNEVINLIFDKCHEILLSRSIVSKDVSSIEREGSFVLLMIYLTALLEELHYHQICFVWKDEDTNDKSIEDFIRYCRNGACHLRSTKNYVDDNFYRFNVFLGCGGAPKIDSKYTDDAAIFFGDVYILYWRHIVRLFMEISIKIGRKVSVEDYMVNI